MGKIPVNSLFNEEQRVEIVSDYTKGGTLASLTKQYKCSRTTVYRILDGAGVIRRPQERYNKSQCFVYKIPPIPFPECRFPGIYKFTNRVNGKIYIGQSRNIHLRYKEHTKAALDSIRFTLALKKYGADSFNFEVLERVDNLDALCEREQYWIDQYQPFDKKKGYNVARSVTKSALGCKHSLEARRALGIRMRAYYANNPSFNIGRKASEETRKKISEAKKLNPFTKEQLDQISAIRVEKMTKRVAQIDIKTSQVIRVWKSVTDVRENLGVPVDCIRAACRGYIHAKGRQRPKNTHAGYKWEYTDKHPIVYSEGYSTIDKHSRKRIAQIHLFTGKTLRVWESAQHIANELGLGAEAIKNTCRGSYRNSSGRHPKTTHAGYKWEYTNLKQGVYCKDHVVVLHKRGKRVSQIDLSTNQVLHFWVSIKDAAQELSLCPVSIGRACRGGFTQGGKFYPKTTHAGFKWQYVE